MNTKTIVKFEASRDNTPMAMVDGKISFPERSGKQPQIGETWEVEVAGTNPTGKVVFLRLTKKVELAEWSWNDGMGSRSRQPACLIVTAAGEVHRFQGSDIPGVVKVVKTKYEKNGKWSNTTHSCVSPQGTSVYSWRQSWEEGLYWPQASWEEAVKTVQQSAPQVDPASLEAVIRQHWGKAATKFDENRNALMAFAQATPVSEPELVEAPITPSTVENFSRHGLSVDQTSAIKQMYGDAVIIGEPKAPFFKNASEFAAQVTGKVASVVAPSDFLLEAQADNLLSDGTVLLFWRADEDARKRGNFAARALLRFTLGERWTKDVITVEPTVEVSFKDGTTFKYGGEPLS